MMLNMALQNATFCKGRHTNSDELFHTACQWSCILCGTQLPQKFDKGHLLQLWPVSSKFVWAGSIKAKFFPVVLPLSVFPSVKGHEATDTGLAYAPVSQAHGHHHTVQCFALLHCSTDQFCTTPGGL